MITVVRSRGAQIEKPGPLSLSPTPLISFSFEHNPSLDNMDEIDKTQYTEQG